VAYLGFTKAAAMAAATKILDVEDDQEMTAKFPFFRTIHSLALMGLKRKRPDVKLIKTADMKQFARVSGMDGAFAVHGWEELADVIRSIKGGGETEWDQALAAYHVTRLQAQSRSDLERAKVEPCNDAFLSLGMQNAEHKIYETFVKHYERFKVAEGLIDFTDMLEHALTDMDPIDVRYGIIDEAQDLCPLHYAIMDRVLSRADEIFWIGDDDQAVFEWSGARSELFLDRSDKAAYRIELRQTHRYGQDIADLAARVIARVGRRYPKTVLPVIGKESNITFSGEFKPVAGDVMILHRFKSGCAQVAKSYMEAGIPFRNERGQDPMGAHAQVLAWGALDQLSRGQVVSMVSAARLIDELMPSTVVGDHNQKVRLVVHGAKAKLENLPNQSVNLWDLVRANLLTSEGAHVIQEKAYRTLKHSENLEFYDRASRNGYDLEAAGPMARVTTIHGAKGRQAREVVIFNEMTGKCWGNPDAEHRLAYVAATRAETNLTICLENKVDWAREIYDYPVEG
jgi:superfamily I DNA/RNA helicase